MIWPPPPNTSPPVVGNNHPDERRTEEETATGRAVLCVTSYRKPSPPPHVLARGDKVDPKTLAVNKGQLITSQPCDKDTPIFLPPPTLSTLFHIQHSKLLMCLLCCLNPPHMPQFPSSLNSQRFRWDMILKGYMLDLQWQVLCRVRAV